jgi:hypothetical protein
MNTTTSHPGDQSRTDTLRAQLIAAKQSLNAEIRSYPGPITGCDVQYQALLEKRAALTCDLDRLNALAHAKHL